MATRRDPRALRRFGIAHVIGAVVVISVVIAGAAMEFAKTRKANIATAKAWDIQGPPCPALTRAEFAAKRYTALKTFPYDEVTIGRTAGDVSCSDVKENGGAGFGTDRVCQFTSPATLTVVSKTSAYFFVPGPGQPSTLIVHKGVPRCVMASKFTLQTE